MSDISLCALWVQDETRLKNYLNISIFIIYREPGNVYYHVTYCSKI